MGQSFPNNCPGETWGSICWLVNKISHGGRTSSLFGGWRGKDVGPCDGSGPLACVPTMEHSPESVLSVLCWDSMEDPGGRGLQ